MIRFLSRMALLAAAGLVAGAVHSYVEPVQLRPANNPVPASVDPAPGDPVKAPGTTPPTSDPGPAAAPSQPTTTPAPATIPGTAAPAPEAAATPNYYITVERAKELWDRGRRDGTVWFVDARPPEQYLQGHVPGAMSLPPSAFGTRVSKVDLMSGSTAVVYCTGKDCTDSEAVMIRLQNLKKYIEPIYIMHDGFGAWAAKGLPVERGPDPHGS